MRAVARPRGPRLSAPWGRGQPTPFQDGDGDGVGVGVGVSVGVGVGAGVGVSVGVGVGVAVSVGVGVGVGVSVGVGVGIAVSVGDGLGEALPGVVIAVPRLWVVASTARITVPSPLSGVGVATGSRAADGLGLICGVGVSIAVTGVGWVAPEWRAPKYTIVNTATSTISPRLAATSVGANIDLIESHRPFLRMASPLLASRALVGPFYP
jgi:hypothetical protein